MSARNLDIRLGADLIRANYYSKKGSELTFGVPGNVLLELESGKLRAVVLLWNVEQMETVKAELRAAGGTK